jgi:hypothetical protein
MKEKPSVVEASFDPVDLLLSAKYNLIVLYLHPPQRFRPLPPVLIIAI